MSELKPTSRSRKPKAVKEEATRLHSQIVRATKGPYCQNACGRLATDAAHIVGRTYTHTRTDEANAFALCAQCHRHFTNWSDDWLRFIDNTIGRPEYERLKAKAQAGVAVKFDWYAELDRLRAVFLRLQREAAS
jgi:5-methylcytosine-specific restriction endonuclease McrA